MRRVLMSLAGCAVLSLAAQAPASGQNWYDSILPEKSHDFGTVARGSKVRHTFRIVNTTSYDVHIADWRTKCGCTDVKVGAKDIPPGTQTTIELTLDTTRFNGYKASGLTLIFDRPEHAQVDLNLTSFIRGEVMLNPGGVDFQAVSRGGGAKQTLALNYYGGRPDWQITGLNTISEHVKAELREVGRSGGTAQYQLTATLEPSAPTGHFRDEITLRTNDAAVPTIPISVTGDVQAAVSIAPAVINLGRLRPGQTVQKTILVRSSKPFKVTAATSEKPELSATSAALGAAKPLHTITVSLTAPSQQGPYNAVLEIATDVEGEPPARLTTFANITP